MVSYTSKWGYSMSIRTFHIYLISFLFIPSMYAMHSESVEKHKKYSRVPLWIPISVPAGVFSTGTKRNIPQKIREQITKDKTQPLFLNIAFANNPKEKGELETLLSAIDAHEGEVHLLVNRRLLNHPEHKELLEQLDKKENVEICVSRALHDKSAIVGDNLFIDSSNTSGNASKGSMEAGVILSDPALIQDAYQKMRTSFYKYGNHLSSPNTPSPKKRKRQEAFTDIE